MIQNPAFVLREVYGQCLLVPVRRNSVGGSPIHLNSTAAEIWKQADSCRSAMELVQSVSDVYGLTPESAEHSAVVQFVDQLMEMQLIMAESGE